MGKKGFYFDQTQCSGCRTCQVACKIEHNLPSLKTFRRVQSFVIGKWPEASVYNISTTCNHCEDPACVKVCPVGAMYIDDNDGTVQHDDDKCIGCQYCAMACPYGQPQYIKELGIVQKCDGCKNLRDQGEDPICVASCCMRAIDFGDFDELKSRYGKDSVSELPVIGSADETRPCLLIKPKENAKQEVGKEWTV